MKRIAIIIYGDLSDRKGYMNASLGMAKALSASPDLEVEVFCLTAFDTLPASLARKVLGMPPAPRLGEDSASFEGMKVRILWYPFSLTDNLLYYKLHLSMAITDYLIGMYTDIFKDFDLLSCQSLIPGMLGLRVKRRHGVPFIVTWHGSDIHSHPWKIAACMRLTRKVMAGADKNIFVSRQLLDKSEEILRGPEKSIVYLGVDREVFRRYGDAQRAKLRREKGVEGKKVTAFVGNLVPVKNAGLLPELFAAIQKRRPSPLCFWVIGDGKLRGEVEAGMKAEGLECRFWGNQAAGAMPDLYNCIDLVVMPSKNEGFGLVPVEALACGANVVASKVGGMKEVLHEEDLVPEGADFIVRFAERAVSYLNKPRPESPLLDFSLEEAAGEERKIILETAK